MNNPSIALIGNPNVGKTLIFNQLTGSRAHVANWPGVTIEKKTGHMDNISITDLPGVYSLTPNAIDDLIARNFILEEKPDLVVDILDATNLERNLYLGLLLKEMNVPLLFVLNMIDSAKKKNIEINVSELQKMLGAPIVATSALTKEGIEELKSQIKKSVQDKQVPRDSVEYSSDIEHKISKVTSILKEKSAANGNSRWMAIKLLEKDKHVVEMVKSMSGGESLLSEILVYATKDEQIQLASARYSVIHEIIGKCIKKAAKVFDVSEFLDKFFLDKYLGIPLFFIFMWVMFEVTFRVATPFMDLIEVVLGYFGEAIYGSLGESIGTSFLVDGLINGLGSIIIFLPNIFLMFLMLSILENTGYLARAAFVMDRLMYKIGLHGRSFVSMLLGFGCNVPAIMSTRAIE